MAMDFGHNFLAPNIIGKDGAEGIDVNDDYSIWDERGGFIYFKGSNYLDRMPVLYNIPDAGNFLFATASDRLGIGYLELLAGSQGNEGIKGRLDSRSDQRAIYRGYQYDSYLKLTTSFGGLGFGFSKERPSWFDPKIEGYKRGSKVTIRR